jgi:hypothetical protein
MSFVLRFVKGMVDALERLGARLKELRDLGVQVALACEVLVEHLHASRFDTSGALLSRRCRLDHAAGALMRIPS